MKVFIENAAGSFIKHIHNEKTLELVRTEKVSRAYPFPYGFVLHTTAEDGDNVDCFILTGAPLRSGQIVECDPIGLMQQVEDGEVDHKVLAVLDGEREELNESIKRTLIEFARHVFDHVPGKIMEVGRFLDKTAALEHVRASQDAAAECG